jgi:glucoamylase
MRNFLISLNAIAGAVASPSFPLYKRQSDINAFIEKETPIAKQGLLNNIGADGELVKGASSGIVVASPSKNDPDCL